MGLTFVLISSFAFGTSGTLASGLIPTGWSPLAIVWHRVLICALATVVPAVIVLRGRWGVLPRNWRLIGAYGTFAICVPQLCHFSAVQYIPVAPALLIQFLAPLLIVLVLWVRQGERPTRTIIWGAVVAMAGMALVLQVFSQGAGLDWRGLAWATAAMFGNAAFFMISAHSGSGLPPVAMTAGGNVVALAVFSLVWLTGVLPWTSATVDVTYAGTAVPYWAPLLVLGLVSSALAYVTGIVGARNVGSRMASFVGLTEVLFATILAAVLVGQLLGLDQVVGAVLVVGGVILVRLGEARLPVGATLRAG